MSEEKSNKPKTRAKKKKIFKGEVISPFKVKDKLYNIGDVYETEHEGSYINLVNKKRVK